MPCPVLPHGHHQRPAPGSDGVSCLDGRGRGGRFPGERAEPRGHFFTLPAAPGHPQAGASLWKPGKQLQRNVQILVLFTSVTALTAEFAGFL